MTLDWVRKPEFPEEAPEAWGEPANTIRTVQRWELNLQQWRFVANVPTIKPPFLPKTGIHCLFKCGFFQCDILVTLHKDTKLVIVDKGYF